MQSGSKTAIYLGIGILVAVAGISYGLSLLEEPVEVAQEEGEAPREVSADKSRFKKAPDLVGISEYINTSQEELQSTMEGKVILYDIWTYSCINCIRTLPHITAWDDKYADDGLLIVGIHSPEFEFEKDPDNVRKAVEKNGIEYPVVLDNEKDTWKAFENRYWPRKYIADHEGYIRYDHIGEGAYKETEKVIQDLLKERAASIGMQLASAEELVDIDEFQHSRFNTPELYFGYQFAQGRNQLGNDEGFRPERDVTYSLPEDALLHYFYLEGTWKNRGGGMELISDSGKILLQYNAKQVNIVAGGDAELDIFLDGEPIQGSLAGEDVTRAGGTSTGEHSLYNLISGDRQETHELLIEVDGKGFEIFTFTFG